MDFKEITQVKDLPEDATTHATDLVISLLDTAVGVHEDNDSKLDLTFLDLIIVSPNFGDELNLLSEQRGLPNKIEYTKEDYAKAVAKLNLIPKGDSIVLVLVIDAKHLFSGLFNGQENTEQKAQNLLFLIDHELCHAHDYSKQIPSLKDKFLKARYFGKAFYTHPLAEICWSEYYANYLGARTATPGIMMGYIQHLIDRVQKTKDMIDAEIIEYRTNDDLDGLMQFHLKHSKSLLVSACFVIGLIDSLGNAAEPILKKISEAISGTYFEETYNSMSRVLPEMRMVFPEAWKEGDHYTSLAKVIETYFGAVGFYLELNPDESVYISIPFRPENTPGLN